MTIRIGRRYQKHALPDRLAPIAAGLATALWACTTPPAAIDDKACTASNHCRMVDGAAECVDGYVWRDDSAGSNDYRCVAVSAADGGSSDRGRSDSRRSDGGRDAGSPDTSSAAPCSGACVDLLYTECTCGSSDPCLWANDGFCDLTPPDQSCALWSSHFDDSADCVGQLDAGLTDRSSESGADGDRQLFDASLPDRAYNDRAVDDANADDAASPDAAAPEYCVGARRTNSPYANSGEVSGASIAQAFTICTAVQLDAIGSTGCNENYSVHCRSHFKLMADLDLATYTGATFHLIGGIRNDLFVFKGSFDGGGHTIANFSFQDSQQNNVGLFRYAEHATFRDLHLQNVNVVGQNNVGAVLGQSNSVEVIGCSVSGQVTGVDAVGGLVGNLSGATGDQSSLKNSSADVTVVGARKVGAVVGASWGSAIEAVTATGHVTGQDTVGGLVGYLWGNLRQSQTASVVTGTDNVGGLVGHAKACLIVESFASGRVQGELRVGGLVGHLESASVPINLVQSSHATGAVSGTGDVGGLVGQNYGCDVDKSSATGAVDGESNIGGLVGYQYMGSIHHSFATGDVVGGMDVGGLIGEGDRNFYDADQIINCYTLGSVRGQSNVGGLIGNLGNMQISNSYASGAVSGTSNIGGLLGRVTGGQVTNVFSTGPVSGNTSSDDSIGPIVGLRAAGLLNGLFYDSSVTVTNSGSGTLTQGVGVGIDVGGSQPSDYFYRQSDAPLNSWDFVGWWRERSNDTPVLQWQP